MRVATQYLFISNKKSKHFGVKVSIISWYIIFIYTYICVYKHYQLVGYTQPSHMCNNIGHVSLIYLGWYCSGVGTVSFFLNTKWQNAQQLMAVAHNSCEQWSTYLLSPMRDTHCVSELQGEITCAHAEHMCLPFYCPLLYCGKGREKSILEP